MSEKIVQLNEAVIKSELKELVRGISIFYLVTLLPVCRTTNSSLISLILDSVSS